MRLLWKYIRSYFLVYHLTSHFLLYLQNYKEFEAEILDLQLEKYGLSFDIKKYTTFGWALGDENVIGIRSFNMLRIGKWASSNFMVKLSYYSTILLFFCRMLLGPPASIYTSRRLPQHKQMQYCQPGAHKWHRWLHNSAQKSCGGSNIQI